MNQTPTPEMRDAQRCVWHVGERGRLQARWKRRPMPEHPHGGESAKTVRRHRTRFGTLALVLVVLAAQLLAPNASAASAHAPAQANSCANLAVQAASAQPLIVRSADEQVKIPKETVDEAVFEANWTNVYKESQQIAEYVWSAYLNAAPDDFYKSPGMDKWQRILLDYRSAAVDLEGNGTPQQYDAIIHGMLKQASETPELQAYVPATWKYIMSLTSDHELYGDQAKPIVQSATRYGHAEGLFRSGPGQLKKLYRCAQKNPVVAEAFDKVNKDRLKAGVRDNAKTIITNNPSLPVLKEISDRIGPDGSITLSLNELTALTKAEFSKINATLDEMQTTIKDIDERQKVIVDYLSNQAEKQAVEALAKKKAEEFQLKISAAQSGLSILTTITAQFSPQRAKQLSVGGNAVLQTVVAVNSWLKATAGRDTAGRILSLSSVVMTGNILSAAMTVFSLFGPQEPPIEQTILEEIGKLRQQVHELRVEMHERFDRIDQNLNNIYTTMMQRFDQIDVQLGKINGNVLEVQQALAELDLRLSRIERNNFEFLNDLGRRPLLDAINGGLDYEQRTGQPMPYQPDFVNFENVLHGWGTIHAFDSVNAGPTQRDYSDGQMLAELSAYPVDANINYINGWLQARGLPAVSTKRLPSPRDWLFASRAYTRLALEWPEHMQRIGPKRQESLNEIGLELEAAMRNLSALTALSGTVPISVGNQLLFTSVISHYQSKVDALEAAIGPVEDAYMNEVRVNRLGRNEPFDVHGYVYQQLSFRSPEVSTGTCNSPQHYSYSMPAKFEERIPNFDLYNLAEYLRLGQLQTCVYDYWYNIVEECANGECYQVADHRVVVNVAFGEPFNAKVLMTQSLPAPRMRIPQFGLWIKDNWTTQPYNYKLVFSSLKELDPMTPAQEAARQEAYNLALKAVETALRNYQHELYGRVMSEMNQGALKPLVTQVAGSKVLLETLVALGMPRAVRNDEFIHAMLYGNQQLVDERLLAQDYALKLAQPITQTSFTYNPRLMLGQVADGRREVFNGLVNEYLNAITAKQHSEEADYIANTRRALDLTMRVVEIEAGGPAANSKRIYLPMVQR